MNEFFKFLETASLLKPRQGCIYLLAGGALLALNRFGIRPFDKLDALYLAIAGISVLIGAAILVVEIGAFTWGKSRESRAKEQAAVAARVSAKAIETELDAEAAANLKTLDIGEFRQLVWILRAGQQRTSQHIEYSLVRKLILRPTKYDNNVYLVRDNIWAMRDELLKRFEDVPKDRDFPVVASLM